ncbi:hypothetical protein FQN60_013492, partial [Etheostoma spectabile]
MCFFSPQLHSDGDRGDGSVRYVLTGEGAGSLFKIDEKSGDIHATKRLDREEKAYYILHAKAINRFTNEALEGQSEFIIKIHDINDNEPRFTKDPYMARVPEMSDIGTSVIQVTAIDADDATYGNSARVVYSILEGQPYFSVDPETGLIKTALPGMDREVKENYQVVIQAKDMAGQMGGLSGTTTVSITLSDVNDNPPRFTKTVYEFRVPESTELGSVVGVIQAMDADIGENAEMDYRIIGSDGPGIEYVGSEHALILNLLIKWVVKWECVPSPLVLPLDFERKRQYSLRIQVENSHINPRFLSVGPFRDEATIKIIVEDVDEPPVFERTSYIMEVKEDAARNTVIGSVSASDPDNKNSLVRYWTTSHIKGPYQCISWPIPLLWERPRDARIWAKTQGEATKYSIDRHIDMDRMFNVHAGNGSVFILRELDREESAWHNISVIATEFNNPRQISRVPVYIRVLDVNDNAPTFATNYETFVCENAKANQVDPDEPLGGHRFFFSLAQEAAGKANFSVRDNKDNTAWILTRRNSYNSLQKSVYHVPVVISDGEFPMQSSTNTLTIQVCTCDREGNMKLCNAEAFTARAGLSTGALVAILLCVIILLSEYSWHGKAATFNAILQRFEAIFNP